MPNTKSGLNNVINCEIFGDEWLIYVKMTVLLTGDWYVTSKGKRPGDERFFSGAFDVFRYISVVFSFVLFGGIEKFSIFAIDKGC